MLGNPTRLKVILALFFATSLSACVRSESTMLDHNTAMISGRGTAFDSPTGVIKEVLTAAAEVTKEQGYRYFVISGGRDTTTRSYLYSPGNEQTTGSFSANTFGNTTTGTYSQSTSRSPGSATELIKPGMDVTIDMYREGEVDPSIAGVWDADSVLAQHEKKE